MAESKEIWCRLYVLLPSLHSALYATTIFYFSIFILGRVILHNSVARSSFITGLAM